MMRRYSAALAACTWAKSLGPWRLFPPSGADSGASANVFLLVRVRASLRVGPPTVTRRVTLPDSSDLISTSAVVTSGDMATHLGISLQAMKLLIRQWIADEF